MSQRCIKCNKIHGMVIENMVTGDLTPIDMCRDCLFENCHVKPTIDEVIVQLHEDNPEAVESYKWSITAQEFIDKLTKERS